MKTGFTGTQRGMTSKQLASFRRVINRIDISEFHHGDCIGADSDAHDVVEWFCIPIIIHPPENPTKRAWRKKAKDWRKPKQYLDRNKNIVNETEVLVATPGEKEEQLRSGTWSTVRYARKQNKLIHIVYPDGSIFTESPVIAELF